MTPFAPEIRDEIRGSTNYTCVYCGKSFFDPEQWLIEAMHNVHRNDEAGGEPGCRICHLLKDLDMGDMVAVNLTANRIWNTGLRKYTQYVENPNLMREDRIQFSEMLSALGLSGTVHITETVHTVNELKAEVARNMSRVHRKTR